MQTLIDKYLNKKILITFVWIFLAVSILKTVAAGFMGQFTHFTLVNHFGTIVRFLCCSSFLIIPLAFFYDSCRAKAIIRFILPILYIVNLFFIKDYLTLNAFGSLGGVANGWNQIPDWFVLTQIILETIFIFLFTAIVWLQAKPNLKKDLLQCLWIFVLALAFLPMNILENFVSKLSPGATAFLTFQNFGLWHLLSFAFLAVVSIGVYLLLKKKTTEQKWKFLQISALIFFFHYASKLSIGLGSGYKGVTVLLAMLPLYICDLGYFIALIAVFSKKVRLLSISFFINAVGAFAIFVYMGMDNLSQFGVILNYSFIYFVLTHAMLFVLCIMPSALRLFQFNLKKVWIDLIIFAIYIIVIAFINDLISNLDFWNYEDPNIYLKIISNYAFTEICPIPLPFSLPSDITFGIFSINIPYLLLLILFHIIIFFTFFGITRLVALISSLFSKKVAPSKDTIAAI